MKENRSEERCVRDPLTGEEATPVSTGVGGLAMATAGAAVGGVGAIAAGAAAGSPAGPIGAAIGGIIGALIGTTLEHKVEQRSNPPVHKTGNREDVSRGETNTSIRALSSDQQEALLDLVVLAMYADGHIATAEERRVYRLLELLGHDSEDKRAWVYDASVARCRKHLSSPDSAAAHASALVGRFGTASEKALAREVVGDFLGVDGRITSEETTLLGAISG